jgi:hypothetical protein
VQFNHTSKTLKTLLLSILLVALLSNATAQTMNAQQIFLNSPTVDSSVVQPATTESQNKSGRKWIVGGIMVAGMGGSLLLLTKINNYDYQKDFHTLNDSKVWLQLDKNEHAFLSYTTTRFLAGMGEWAGYPAQKSVLLGSAASLLYLTTKEYLDGHQTYWGWSWTDMGANLFGTTLFAAQELGWHEQKIQLKFSALPKKYEPDLDARADILFGNRVPERILKDYNAQTYWLSFNLKTISTSQKLPDWLNLAVGYGASNLYGPYDNLGYSNGEITFDRSDLKRYRQWYLSPDIDLTKIKTKRRGVKTLLFALNAVKVPLPALEFSNKKLKGHLLHF